MKRDNLHCTFFVGCQTDGLEDCPEAAFSDFVKHLVLFIDISLLDFDEIFLVQDNWLEDAALLPWSGCCLFLLIIGSALIANRSLFNILAGNLLDLLHALSR